MKLLETIPMVLLLFCLSCTEDIIDIDGFTVKDDITVITDTTTVSQVSARDAILGIYIGTSVRTRSRPEEVYDSVGNVLDIIIARDTSYSTDTMHLGKGSSDSTFFVELYGQVFACANGWRELDLVANDAHRYFEKDGYQHYYQEENELIIDPETGELTSRRFYKSSSEYLPPTITRCLFSGQRE